MLKILLAWAVVLSAHAKRPGEKFDYGVQKKPTKYDWVIKDGAASSQRQLGRHDLSDKGLGDLYRLSRQAGHKRPIVFGCYDDCGVARVGGTWGPGGRDSLTHNGEEASATFVGLNDTAEVRLAMMSSHNKADPTGSVRAYDIGLRGFKDSFVLRANGGARDIQFDGIWYLPWKAGEVHTSTLHIDGAERLIIRNVKWRGKTPNDPGIRVREHAVAYIKSISKSILIENNNMFGGNRTGVQIRPDNIGQKGRVPTGPVMFKGNYCWNCGGNHQYSDGGAVITSWISTGGLYIYDNTFRNFRYKALVLSGQDPDKNFPTRTGNQHADVYLSNNTFTRGPLTERSTIGASSIDYLRVYDDNTITGKFEVDAVWNVSRNGTRNRKMQFWTTDGALKYDLYREGKKVTEKEYRGMMKRWNGRH